jgi:hypothetical protein
MPAPTPIIIAKANVAPMIFVMKLFFIYFSFREKYPFGIEIGIFSLKNLL